MTTDNRAEVSDAMLEVAARAHDREDAAQKGEPSPWEVFADELDPEWIEERKVAMRCAFEAVQSFRAFPTAQQGGVDQKALDLTKRIEREFYYDHPGGAAQVRGRVQSILAEALTVAYRIREKNNG